MEPYTNLVINSTKNCQFINSHLHEIFLWYQHKTEGLHHFTSIYISQRITIYFKITTENLIQQENLWKIFNSAWIFRIFLSHCLTPGKHNQVLEIVTTAAAQEDWRLVASYKRKTVEAAKIHPLVIVPNRNCYKSSKTHTIYCGLRVEN